MNEEEIQELVERYFKGLDPTCNIRKQTNFGNSVFDGIVLMGECLIGYEIKGDRDNYNRLKTQLLDYTFVCDRVYLVTNEKDIPENLPGHVGWLAVRNGKIKELKKPITIPQRDMEFMSKEIIEKTLKESKLPLGFSGHIREFIKVANSFYRPLLLNYVFQWDKTYKVKPLKNSTIIKMYLGRLNHLIENSYSENIDDWEINNRLKGELDNMTESFRKFRKILENYSLFAKEHQDILLKKEKKK